MPTNVSVMLIPLDNEPSSRRICDFCGKSLRGQLAAFGRASKDGCACICAMCCGDALTSFLTRINEALDSKANE